MGFKNIELAFCILAQGVLFNAFLQPCYFWGFKPISSVVLTQGNAMLLICVFYEVQDTTKVLLQYSILLI